MSKIIVMVYALCFYTILPLLGNIVCLECVSRWFYTGHRVWRRWCTGERCGGCSHQGPCPEVSPVDRGGESVARIIGCDGRPIFGGANGCVLDPSHTTVSRFPDVSTFDHGSEGRPSRVRCDVPPILIWSRGTNKTGLFYPIRSAVGGSPDVAAVDHRQQG